MSIEIDAIYEDGAFRPLQAPPFKEHQRVRLTVEAVGAKAESAPGQESEWWTVLKQIIADQDARGFHGTVSEFRRDDEAYEQRMREILANTIQHKTDG
jgi:predicted DNA-binding antitoxin AbrB/MazE fold protein